MAKHLTLEKDNSSGIVFTIGDGNCRTYKSKNKENDHTVGTSNLFPPMKILRSTFISRKKGKTRIFYVDIYIHILNGSIIYNGIFYINFAILQVFGCFEI